MLEVTPIKTSVINEGDGSCKIIQFSALSNGEFVVDTFEFIFDIDGWSNGEEPLSRMPFQDYISATSHFDEASKSYTEVSVHDPIDAIEEMINTEIEWEKEFEKEQECYRRKQYEAKQVEYDKVKKFEATCRKTGDRMIFTSDTEEKALKLANVYFTGGILKFEQVHLKVKADKTDYLI